VREEIFSILRARGRRPFSSFLCESVSNADLPVRTNVISRARRIRDFHLEIDELQLAAKGEILKSEQVEMLMLHFSGAPDWAGRAMCERSGQSRSTSKENFRNSIKLMVMQRRLSPNLGF
jgi:hypothetical protein